MAQIRACSKVKFRAVKTDRVIHFDYTLEQLCGLYGRAFVP